MPPQPSFEASGNTIAPQIITVEFEEIDGNEPRSRARSGGSTHKPQLHSHRFAFCAPLACLILVFCEQLDG
jgi:hypothetical protein